MANPGVKTWEMGLELLPILRSKSTSGVSAGNREKRKESTKALWASRLLVLDLGTGVEGPELLTIVVLLVNDGETLQVDEEVLEDP